MIKVRPIDLANACTIFLQLRSNTLPLADFTRAINRSKTLDCDVPGSLIINEAISCNLISTNRDRLTITETGKKLANAQNQLSTVLSSKAAECLLHHVFLNIENKGIESAQFFSRFRPDAELGTFVLMRPPVSPVLDVLFLHRFHSLGLIEVGIETAIIRPNHLGEINELLRKYRGVSLGNEYISDSEKQRIGNYAETKALEHEHERLERLGRQELIPLIQQISKIDSSAGYDIRSFCGKGNHPDDEMYIEVKGTSKPYPEFIWSYNERCVAQQCGKKYWIYIFTNVDYLNGIAQGPHRVCDPSKAIDSDRYVIEPLDIRVKRIQKHKSGNR